MAIALDIVAVVLLFALVVPIFVVGWRAYVEFVQEVLSQEESREKDVE